MTQENKPSLLAMPCPFAGAQGAAMTAINNTSGNSVNFKDGFPAVYASPTTNNGKFVTRGEMNAIGNLASNNDFHFRCGGINTFNKSLSDLIDGYPKGAILEKLEGNNLNKVISLIDNNKINFNDVGVDGVNWMYLNVPGSVIGFETILSSDIFSSEGASVLGSYIAVVQKILNIQDGVVLSRGSEYQESYSAGAFSSIGHGVIAKEFDTQSPTEEDLDQPKVSFNDTGAAVINWNGWKRVSGNYGFITVSKHTSPILNVSYMPIFNAVLTKDKYYQFCYTSNGKDFVSSLWSESTKKYDVDLVRYAGLSGNVTIGVR